MMEPLYSTLPGGMRLLNAIIALLLRMAVVIAVGLLAFVSALSAAITFASIATFALIWLILPRRYEVWPDHLRLVFPAWGWDLPYEGIETVRAGRWYEAYGFAGVRFAMAPSQTVTILRHNANMLTHPNVVISPADREQFLRQLQRAMQT